jgi:hypothetical protein
MKFNKCELELSPTINKKELSSKMSKLVKNIIALSVSSALSISFIQNVNAATYQIIDKGTESKLKYTYAQRQNSSGDMAISGTNLYNFPVQYQYLDANDYINIINYSASFFSSNHSLDYIEDVDALVSGNPTANDLAWVVLWLQDTSSGKGLDLEYQKVGDSIAMTNINGVTDDFNLWDESFSGVDDLTRSTVDILSGITDNGVSYGTATAPYLPEDVFTDVDGEEHVFWIREHGIRGFYSYDQGAKINEIIPFETQYGGGESAILDVSETGIAVGYSSYKLVQSYKDLIESDSGGCADTTIVPDQLSLEACIAQTVLQSTTTLYHTMALQATLDENGNPVLEQLGLLVEPHQDDERSHSSFATAVNNQGVAVGYANGWVDEQVTTPAVDESSLYQLAVAYKNGDVIDLTGDHTDKAGSRAYDINDSGIAVGHITRLVGGSFVQKFFYVDTTVPEGQIEMVYPDDFFEGSESTARAINNSGLIVGEGEIETHNESTSNPRRTAAFVYNLNDDVITNLNENIPCSDRAIYTIFEARDINDEGIISANAIISVDRRDAEGELMLDDNGIPLTEDVVRAISLEPTPEDGEICTSEEEGKIERQGASFSFGPLLVLLSLFGLRRKFKKLTV